MIVDRFEVELKTSRSMKVKNAVVIMTLIELGVETWVEVGVML